MPTNNLVEIYKYIAADYIYMDMAIQRVININIKNINKESPMDTMHLKELFDDRLKTVSVVFENSVDSIGSFQKKYTYKTYDDFKVGDYAVVLAEHNLKVVKVADVHDSDSINYDSAIKYKWVVSKVDYMKFEEFSKKQDEIDKKLSSMVQQLKKKQALKKLITELGISEEEVVKIVRG